MAKWGFWSNKIIAQLRGSAEAFIQAGRFGCPLIASCVFARSTFRFMISSPSNFLILFLLCPMRLSAHISDSIHYFPTLQNRALPFRKQNR